MPPDRPLPVGSEQDFAELVGNADLPVLVDFWADWCGPCRMVAPELAALARERTGKLVVAKVDTERLPGVAGRYEIRSIPTLILFQGGREAKRISGALPKQAIVSQFGI